VVSPVLDGSLAGDKSLDVVAEHGGHSKTAVLDLLDLKLGELGLVLGKTKRVKSASRVDGVGSFRLGKWSTVHTVSLGSTHKDNLEREDSDDGLSVDEVRVAKVVKTTLSEDLSSSLEPDRLGDRDTSVLGEDFREEASKGTKHSEASVDDLSLTVTLESLRISGKSDVVPSVVSRELTGEVGRDFTSERTEPLTTVGAVELGIARVLENSVISAVTVRAGNVLRDVLHARSLELVDHLSSFHKHADTLAAGEVVDSAESLVAVLDNLHARGGGLRDSRRKV